MSQPVNFTTPVGRLVFGSLYKERTTDMSGRPLVVKSGPNINQPRKEWAFGLAIPKGAEAQQHPGNPNAWMVTAWGQSIRQVAEAFKPNATQLPAFAWKVKDGDSQVPNTAGRKPADNEGWPGHWVLVFSSGFAPKCYTLIGQSTPTLLDQPDAINLGDYVQVAGSIAANGDHTKPGVFLNHSMVCHVAYGPRIVVGPDVASAGFGGGALPAGASLTPPAGFSPPVAGPAGVPAVPGAPALPGGAPSLPAPSLPMVPGAPALPTAPSLAAPALPAAPIVPNPAILQPPAGTAVPALPQAPVRNLTAKAQGASYEQLIAAGWTDATLVQHGLMAA